MDPISLDQLQVLLTVVEEGSFSAAARRLNRVQSAVSYAIANLERLLGVPLFDRSARRPVLTPQGEALLAEARMVTHHMERLQAQARRMNEGTEPQVSLVVDVMFPMAPLLGALDAFRQEFPDVSLLLHTEALGAVAQRVLDGVCQLGISGPLRDFPREIESRPLLDVPLVTVVAASHPLARVAGPVPTPLLQAHTQLVLTDRSPLTEGVDVGVVQGAQWRLADLHTKHTLLKAGFGWGNMPLHQVAEDLATGALVQFQPAEWAASITVPQSVIFRRADPPGPAGRWLIDRMGRVERAA